MKRLTTFSLLIGCCLLTTPATAGWFDDLFAKEEVKPAVTQTQDTDLVSNVMSQLGLSQSQAEGGLGSLLTLAKSSLGSADFGSISTAIPNVDELLSAAPEVDNQSGISGLLSQAGDLGSSLQGGAQVYDAFAKLAISKELAAPMVNIVKGYLDTNAGEGSSDLLMKGLSAIL